MVDLEQILDPEFKPEDLSWESKVNVSAHLFQEKELFVKVVGKIASTLKGSKEIKQLALDIQNITGKKMPPSSIIVYRWLYEKVYVLNPPDDISLNCLKHIASTDNPQKWVDEIKNNGLSGAEVIRMIRLEKGMETKVKKCPNCGIALN